jgi:hypothetical protein
MVALPLALAVAAMALFLGCCTAVLFRYRKSRLAAEAMHLLDRWDPTAETITLPVFPMVPAQQPELPHRDLTRLSGLTLAEAEDLFDWLEQNGFEERGLLCESGASFAVEFRLNSARLPASPLLAPPRRNTAG